MGAGKYVVTNGVVDSGLEPPLQALNHIGKYQKTNKIRKPMCAMPLCLPLVLFTRSLPETFTYNQMALASMTGGRGRRTFEDEKFESLQLKINECPLSMCKETTKI